jgi:glutamyl/glutaminyl-tRNA synthetase
MASPTGNTVTRFAPSPTGALHVGGARTALFAWAYARRHAGSFLLRIEDTDLARSSEASTRGIIDDLRWLGLAWDQGPDVGGPSGPYLQSQRLEHYNAAVDRLLDAGLAYEDNGAIRFRPPARDVTWRDEVYGQITVKRDQQEDFVIRKGETSGGGGRFPTFHLAVVVDDELMGVTHVFRGQEHISNTWKHVALQDALGFRRPVYVHMPSIMNPDGSKMSKRDKAKAARAAAEAAWKAEGAAWKAEGWPSLGFGADAIRAFMEKQSDDAAIASAIADVLSLQLPEIEVADFRRSGYLPEVLLNYLALLGWNPGNDVERFDRDFIVGNFSIERINKGNSKFDRVKLAAFNQATLAGLAPEDFARLLREHFEREQRHASFLHRFSAEQFRLFALAYQPRAKTLDEPAHAGVFFVLPDDEIAYDDKAMQKNVLNGGSEVLGALRDRLAALDPWTGEAAHEAVSKLAQDRGIGMGKVAQPLRVAITGDTVSPPIDLTLAILGRDATLERIDRCLAAARPQAV